MQSRHNPAKKTLPKCNSLRAKSKNDEKYLKFLMTFFPQNVILDTVDAVLTIALKKLQIRAEHVRSFYEYGKIQIFCSEKFFSKFFLRIRWRQFSKLPKKNSSKNEKKSVQWAKKVTNFNFFVFLTLQIIQIICTKI